MILKGTGYLNALFCIYSSWFSLVKSEKTSAALTLISLYKSWHFDQLFFHLILEIHLLKRSVLSALNLLCGNPLLLSFLYLP